jgi:integrase
MRGDGRIFQRGPIYWVAYYLRGKEHREAAKTKDGVTTSDPNAATKFLRARLKEVHADEVGGRTFTTSRACRLTVFDLVEALKADYALRGKLSTQNISYLKRVQADFGDRRAIDLTAEHIDRYIEQRLEDGSAKASLNRVTQMLGQAYVLAVRREHLSRAPYIRRLSEKGNERTGFFCEPEARAVISHLPNNLKDFVLFAYLCGWRKGSIASLRWIDVDLEAGEMNLPSQFTKNGEPLKMVIEGELASLMKRRNDQRAVKTESGVVLSALVFHRNGRPVAEFKKSWATA